MVSTAQRNALSIRQFPSYPSLCFKSNHLCENDFLILMQINLIFRSEERFCRLSCFESDIFLNSDVVFLNNESKTAIKKLNLKGTQSLLRMFRETISSSLLHNEFLRQQKPHLTGKSLLTL